MECFVNSLFLTFCLGVFRGNPAQVKEYEELLQAVIFQSFEGNFWTHTHTHAYPCASFRTNCQSMSHCDGLCLRATVLQPLPMSVIFPLLFIRVVLSYSSLPRCVISLDAFQSSAQQRRCSLFKQTRTPSIPHWQTKNNNSHVV